MDCNKNIKMMFSKKFFKSREGILKIILYKNSLQESTNEYANKIIKILMGFPGI